MTSIYFRGALTTHLRGFGVMMRRGRGKLRLVHATDFSYTVTKFETI